MMPIFALLAFGLAQQPQSQAPRQGAASAPRAQTASLNTTMTAVTDVAAAVADVKAEADRFRTRAFNDPAGAVLESAASFKAACERLAAAARKAPPMICRSCMRGGSQPAFDRYRAYMPSLAGLGGRCVARLRAGASADASQAQLRRTSIDMSNLVVTGLRPYEQRIGEIRAHLQPATPRPSQRPGGD